MARPGFVAYLFVVQCTTAVLCRCFYIRFVLPLIAGQWRKLLGKLGLVRPADALPPDRNILHFGDPEKGLGPRTSELALHEGQQFAAPTRTLPREDPSIGETTPSANQRAYAEDAKQLIR